jgi:hypothetical protein
MTLTITGELKVIIMASVVSAIEQAVKYVCSVEVQFYVGSNISTFVVCSFLKKLIVKRNIFTNKTTLFTPPSVISYI